MNHTVTASCCGAHHPEGNLKKLSEVCSGVTMTLVGGVCLAASLIARQTQTAVPADSAWVAVVICGYPILYHAAWRMIFGKGILKISSTLLISVAMTSCIFIDELFAAGQVAFIMAIGALLENRTLERAKKDIKQLISLVPGHGRIIKGDKEKLIPLEQVRAGDILRVLPGEAMPVDGEILSGATSIDQAVITGESLPIDKTVGDNVFCGTINRFGSIDIKATKIGEDASLQKLIRLVQEAEHNKASLQRIIDRWAAWLVPLALAIAAATYLATGDSIRAATVAIVFCPCALALATPTSVMAAIGQAAKYGVIIKSGDALERMGKVDVVAFDKTGTLTNGNLVVSDVLSFDPKMGDRDFLSLAASAEAHSEHPLGKAIVAYAREQGITIQPIDNFNMIPGKGVRANINGQTILCGNSHYLHENCVALDDNATAALELLRKQGKAVILVSYNEKCQGIIALSDTLRATARNIVQELQQKHINVVILTGDNRQTADYFAEQAGIQSVYAELLPAQKVERIQELQKAGRYVCMIGDGVNDAPALKTASVGVAMGSMGSDIAIEAADIALIGDDISKIAYVKRLSRATVRLIVFNITISIVFNIVAIALSMLGLLTPITGALAHNAAAVLVVLNATLLYDRNYLYSARSVDGAFARALSIFDARCQG
ncbi:MAG: cation-translocating P-type ATPase [Deltaproteobacteria bacterium]|nr:cation-translocating P-type ATPase [Deltaproteobacteria bacterium]